MIELKNINKFFGNKKVLEDINLQFNSGEVIAIIGSSGSGKSTLLRIINQLELQNNGDVIVDQVRLNEKNISEQRQNIGMVFQNFNLFSNMSVIENITCPLINVKKISKEQAIVIAKEKLEKVGLLHKMHEMPKMLSGGEKQRVAIARCIAMEPKILLFDEPTSALDPKNVKEIIDLIREIIFKDTIVIFITHEMYFMKSAATRVILLEKGKIIADMPKNEFLKSELDHIKDFMNE
ncbi:MAG: amino acid ABC transporter ATP-binding protein [Sphingobacteriia bacterium]|nr:amino acid ABC transporter ATP-binding protein [Sphingobacteriia bacterium]